MELLGKGGGVKAGFEGWKVWEVWSGNIGLGVL